MADSETKSIATDGQCQDTGQTEETEVTSASGDSSNGGACASPKSNPFQGIKPAKFAPGITVPGMNPFASRPSVKADVVSTSGTTGTIPSPAKFILRPSSLSSNPHNQRNEVTDGVPGAVASLLKPAKLPDPTKPLREQEVTEKENTEASSIFTDKTKEPPDSSHENLFQSALKDYSSDKKLPDSSSSPSSASSSSNHVTDSDSILGQNLTEKVTGVHTSPKGVVSSSGFVFGENLAERVQFNMDEKKGEENNGVASPDSTDQTEGAASEQEGGKSLEESAREYQAIHSKKHELEEVEVLTGEENESNVLQTNGKLFMFDGETQNWVERGRGLLRLNDMRCPSSQTFQSRLLMRTQGSLRLILNTKIWPGMTVERASNKNIRITGTDGDAVKVFLISTNLKDSENILRALDWRIQQLRVQEEQEKGEGGGAKFEGKRKAEPESPTETDEFSSKKTKKSDDEGISSYRREESDSSVVDPETEVSSESHASSFTLRTDSD